MNRIVNTENRTSTTLAESLLPETSIRDLAFVFFKRKWSIVAIIVMTMVGAVVWLWFIRDDAYAVTAKVLVKLGQEQAPPATLVGQNPEVIGYRTTEVNSELDIFQSTELIGIVVDRLGLDKPRPPAPVPTKFIPRIRYEGKQLVRRIKDWQDELLITLGLRERLTPREKVIAQFQAGLTVMPQRDSNVFIAQLKLPERVGSSVILKALLDDYQVFRAKVYQGQGGDVFLDKLEQTGSDLRAAEQQQQDFEKAGNITEFSKQEEVLLEQIARARNILKDAESAYQESASKVENLDRELRKPEPNLGAVGEFDRESFPGTILRQLSDLDREREKLRSTDLDSSERLQSNRRQFLTLADLLAANLRSTMGEKKSTYELREAALDNLQSELESLHGKQMQLDGLKRKKTELEGIYTFYRKKVEELSATSALERKQISNVAVIQYPSDPLQPEGMRKTVLLGLCALVAVFVAIVWVAIAEFFDHRVYRREDVERHLKAPVLATIGHGTLSGLVNAPGTFGRRTIGTYAGES
jgi:uncharacterized protein involved in exopolysaccharide biosynthesis